MHPVLAASSSKIPIPRPQVQPEEPKWPKGKKRLKVNEAKEARIKARAEAQVIVNHDFNRILVKELRNALRDQQYHSLSTLYSALCVAGLKPFSTKAEALTAKDGLHIPKHVRPASHR